MKTYGELVTQIKSGMIDLSNEFSIAGSAQLLGPAHAYGRSFLILESIRELQTAVQTQETRLKALVSRESAHGPVSHSDPKLWRVIDSVFQSLSLIDRYVQDPSRYTHQGLVEWLKQESAKFGLSSSFVDDSDELEISAGKFTLCLAFSEEREIANAVLVLIDDGQQHMKHDVPDLIELLQFPDRTEFSHRLSMAARLNVLESTSGAGEPVESLVQAVGDAFTDYGMTVTLGGLRLPFVDGYSAILTFDSFEQVRKTLMVVIDPPIAFPHARVESMRQEFGIPHGNLELSAAASISKILKLPTDVTRQLDGQSVRLLLNDDNVPSIMLARWPIAGLADLSSVIDTLTAATVWCKTIRDAFCESEGGESRLSIDVAPVEDFTLGVTYWIGDAPERLAISVQPDETVQTDNPRVNSSISGTSRHFSDVIAQLLRK
jgi:hypothetical protein